MANVVSPRILLRIENSHVRLFRLHNFGTWSGVSTIHMTCVYTTYYIIELTLSAWHNYVWPLARSPFVTATQIQIIIFDPFSRRSGTESSSFRLYVYGVAVDVQIVYLGIVVYLPITEWPSSCSFTVLEWRTDGRLGSSGNGKCRKGRGEHWRDHARAGSHWSFWRGSRTPSTRDQSI